MQKHKDKVITVEGKKHILSRDEVISKEKIEKVLANIEKDKTMWLSRLEKVK